MTALARAFYWQELVDTGVSSSVTELAEALDVRSLLHWSSRAAGASGTRHRRGDHRRTRAEWAVAGTAREGEAHALSGAAGEAGPAR